MALLNNHCKYPNCNNIYMNLNDLIVHVEQEHVDFSCEKVQQLDDEKPECLPLSYILKYNNNENNELPLPIFLNNNNNTNEHSYSSNEPVIIDSFDINDFSKLSDRIFDELIQTTKPKKLPKSDSNKEKKPFVCTIPGCHKSYKNKNGIKYHCQNYHNCNKQTITSQSLLKFNQFVKLATPPPPPPAATTTSGIDQPKVKVESTYDLDDFSFTNLTSQKSNNDVIYSNYQRYTSNFDNNQVPLNNNQSFNNNYYKIDEFPSI